MSNVEQPSDEVRALLFTDLDSSLSDNAVGAIHAALDENPGFPALFGDAVVDGSWRRRGAWSPIRLATDPTDLDLLVVRCDEGARGPTVGLAARLSSAAGLIEAGTPVQQLMAPLIARGATADLDNDTRAAHRRLAAAVPVAVREREEHDRFAVVPTLSQATSVVIPSAATAGPDGRPMLERCLTGLAAVEDLDIVLVVGPELTTDITAIAEAHGARVIRRPGDEFNFSAAVNHGVLAARHPLVAIVNDDTESSNGAWLDQMAAHFADPDVAAVGALLTYPDGTIQHAGVALDDAWPLHSFVGWDPEQLHAVHCDIARDVVAATGACLMVRRSAMLAVGGLCADLPLSFNDIDLCLKLRYAGHRVVFDPDARLTHYESASRVPEIAAWEWDTFVSRWGEVVDPWYHPGHHRPDNPSARHRNADHLDPDGPARWFGTRDTQIRPQVHRGRSTTLTS